MDSMMVYRRYNGGAHFHFNFRFFVSHLVSIPSKPKSDLDCKSCALKLLAVVYVVLSLVTVKSSVKVEDVEGISKEVKFFLESLSEEHEERSVNLYNLSPHHCRLLNKSTHILRSPHCRLHWVFNLLHTQNYHLNQDLFIATKLFVAFSHSVCLYTACM